VRTNPSAPKHRGISFLLFDMATSGVSTRPIRLISGNSPFCETFFDDVKVPKDQVVGEVDKGWDVAKYLLGHEREMISGMGVAPGSDGTLGSMLADLVGRDADGRIADPFLRADIARFDVDALAFRAMSERFMDELKTGQAHPAQPSMMKYAGTELNKRRHEIVMAAGGADFLEWESERSRDGKAAREWLRTKANSIEGGTSEIQLGIVAKRILELPGS
jgi:alkylation response protein AidB-like acyl-CoA dehydrogenase